MQRRSNAAVFVKWATKVLVDTDILVWYMRGHGGAARFLSGARPFSISTVTFMELVQGMRDKRELAALRRALKSWRTPVLAITEPVSNRAVVYVEEHFPSHALRLADALIGATAMEHGLPLATADTKHFKVIPGLILHPFKP